MEAHPGKKHTENAEKIIYVPMASPMNDSSEEEEFNILNLWDIVWYHKKIILGVTLGCTLLCICLTFYVLPTTYQSNAVLLPNQNDSNALSQLSGLMGNIPLPISLPGGGEVDKVSSFLGSRTLKKRLIEKFDLLPRYYPEYWNSDTQSWEVKNNDQKPTVIKALQTKLIDDIFFVHTNDETGLITLTWEDEDPAFTALMLQRVINELQFYLDNEYETDAAQNRQFVEQRLANATRDLEYWEEQTPSKEMTLAKIQRERLATQTVYTELRKQLELAKITEAKEVIDFKTLDVPFVPEKHFQPRRFRMCLLTMITSGIFSLFLVFGYRYIYNLRKQQK